MTQSVIQMFRDGQNYMNTWPSEKVLNPIFPEGKVIAATKLAMVSMPPIAIVSCFALLDAFGSSYLPQAFAIFAFFLSLPLQGLLWLGHRANQVLPPQLRNWYAEVHQKMREQGCHIASPQGRPRYMELATLLNKAFRELDRVFTSNLLR